ncbi:MAG: hypothetical protein KDB26_15655 [Microthrixaceae bacterium]|nr:hypothetical protein [Microthrixaceae bacterium]
MATGTAGTVRELADDPVHFDHDDFQGIVSDAADAKITKDNVATSTAASLVDEMKAVIAEAVEEAGKLATAEKNLYDATIAFTEASTPAERETAKKGVLEAMDALDAARAEYERREAEILAKIADILARMDGISDGDDAANSDRWDEDDPNKPKSDKPSNDSPGDKPSSNSPVDSPSSDSPTDKGQTQLSSDTSPTAQQQPQQAQVQAQPQQPTMSPSSGMPQQSPNVSPSAFNVRPRSDKDKDKPKSDTDLGAMPVAAPVATPVPIDRGTSVNGGVTTRDVSGKPSTSLSTSGQVPGGANTNNARGMGGSGGMVGGAPIGGGNKADTSAKRSSKRFDIESLFKPDDNDQSVNSGALSKDSLAATEKAREDERNRMQEAMRESVKRLMNKKAG